MKNKKSLIYALITLVLIFTFSIITNQITNQEELEEARGHRTIGGTIGQFSEFRLERQDCEKDSDCIFVNSSCCGCEEMGGNTAINKIYETEWNNKLLKVCKERFCTIGESTDTSCIAEPKCHNSKCEIVRKGVLTTP